MTAEQQWIGYGAFKKELESLRQSAYILVGEPGLESIAIEAALREIAEQHKKERKRYYELRRFEQPGETYICSLNQETAEKWEEALVSWKSQLQSSETDLEETALRLLETLRNKWPDLVLYHTELTEYALQKGASALDESILPRRLNEENCPVVVNRRLSDLTGSPNDWEKAMGGYLLIDARSAYSRPEIWQDIWQNSMIVPVDVQIILYGTAELYALWSEEDADFASLFGEVRRFPSKVPNSPPNRQRWYEYISDGLDPIITEEAREFLLSLISGLTYRQLPQNIGYLPGRLTRADPWLEECQWLYQEKNQGLVNIAIVKEVWQHRQRRAAELRQTLCHYALPCQKKTIGTMYSLALYDMGYCQIVQTVRVNAQRQKQRLRRKKDEIQVSLESDWSLTEEGEGVLPAITYAVVSAMEQQPLRQDLAVIGHIDEEGVFLPISNAAELIAGFYEICRQQGCETGGVLFPAGNALNLQLSPEIAEAVKNGQFFLYPVRTMIEGIPIVMGLSVR